MLVHYTGKCSLYNLNCTKLQTKDCGALKGFVRPLHGLQVMAMCHVSDKLDYIYNSLIGATEHKLRNRCLACGFKAILLIPYAFL